MVEQHIKANMGIYAIPAVAHAVQGDTARVFIFDVVDYEIQGTETASLMCVRPNGTSYSYAGTVSAANNTVTVDMDINGGALSQAGVVSAQLVMTISSKVVCSYNMGIIVHEALGGTSTQDQKDFLTGLQAQMDDYIATATADITQNTSDITALENKLSTIVGFKRFNVPKSGSATLTFKNGAYTRCLIVVDGYSIGTKSMYIATCTDAGTVSGTTVLAGTNISYSSSSYTLTIANDASNNQAYAEVIIFIGDVT